MSDVSLKQALAGFEAVISGAQRVNWLFFDVVWMSG